MQKRNVQRETVLNHENIHLPIHRRKIVLKLGLEYSVIVKIRDRSRSLNEMRRDFQ